MARLAVVEELCEGRHSLSKEYLFFSLSFDGVLTHNALCLLDTLLRLEWCRGLQHPFLSFSLVATHESVVRCGLLYRWGVRVENTDFAFDYQIERVDSIRAFVESLARF